MKSTRVGEGLDLQRLLWRNPLKAQLQKGKNIKKKANPKGVRGRSDGPAKHSRTERFAKRAQMQKGLKRKVDT